MAYEAHGLIPAAARSIVRSSVSLLFAVLFGSNPVTAQVAAFRESAAPASVPAETSFFRDLRVAPMSGVLAGGGLSIDSPLLGDPAADFLGMKRSSRPEDADFKAGDLYVDISSISGGLLFSDNIHSKPTEPVSGGISVVRLGTAVMWQFSEGLRLGLAGSVVYLPGRGQVGIAGFGVDDPTSGFTQAPLFQAQLVFSPRVGEWQLKISNDFVALAAPPTRRSFGFEFHKEDRIGRYVFRDSQSMRESTDASSARVYTARVSASRAMPGFVRMTVGSDSAYWWTDAGADNQSRQRSRGFISASYDRDNARLKPFAHFSADLPRSEERRTSVGVAGSLTENLTVIPEGGFFSRRNGGTTEPMWRVRIKHTPGPLTSQESSYGRTLAEPFSDLEETWSYRLQRRMNSTLTGEFIVSRTRFELHDASRTRGVDWEVYGGLQANVLPEGGLAIHAGNERSTQEARERDTHEAWVGRLRVRYRSFETDLHYRDHERYSAAADIRVRERLVMLTLTKHL